MAIFPNSVGLGVSAQVQFRVWCFQGCVGSGIWVPVSVSGLFPDGSRDFGAGSEVFPVRWFRCGFSCGFRDGFPKARVETS